MATQYARSGNRDWVQAIKARWWTAWGFGPTGNAALDGSGNDYAASNNFLDIARSADGQSDLPIWRRDSDDALRIGEEAITPMSSTINFPLSTNASIVTQHFFIAPIAMEVTAISCIFAVADGAANTGYVTHETGAQAPGTGATVMNGTFNLNATANTAQNATLWKKWPASGGVQQTANFRSVIKLAAGDRLSFKIASAVTSLAGLVISIAATPGGKGVMAVYNMQANGDLADQSFFLANRDLIVSAAYYAHSTLGTNGSAVNVQLTKDTSTNAPGAGTDMLTNSTNAGFDCKAAINVVQTGVLATTAGLTRLAPGDRLSVDFSGTLTALAGVVLVVLLQPIQARKEITLCINKNANIVDQAVFIADRTYLITDASAVWSVAAASGNIQLTRDKATDAPGAGTDLLSMDTNAGWQVDGTANTPEVATWKDTRFNYLLPGDRLSIDCAVGASIAGFTATISLKLV